MKIALLTDGIYPFVMGGMQRHSYYMCKFLAQRGVFIDLYHCIPDAQKHLALADYFTAEELAYLRTIEVPFPPAKKYPGHYVIESSQYAQAIWQELVTQLTDIDLIFAKGFAGWEVLRQKKRGAQLPPVAVKLHGYEMFQLAVNLKHQLQLYLLRPVARFQTLQADIVYSYGGKITQHIQDLGVPIERIVEVPSGIEANWLIEKPLPQQGPRRLIFVGRYEVRKGIRELLQALQRLSGQYDFAVDMVGPIPAEAQVPIPEVTYHGPVRDKAKLQALLRQAQVLVCPSYSEGMPNVILEGMASGCAIIGTHVGAVSAMVNDQNGWLIPPAQTDALQTALIAAITHPTEALQQKRLHSLARIENELTWEMVSERLYQSLKEQLRRKTQPTIS